MNITNNKIADYYISASKGLDFLSPLLDLALRIWVAKVFFMSGLTKIQSWDTTIMLFQYEYNVPILSPTIAAYMGTAAELTLPILLLAGFFSRPTALALFVFNIVAAISYADISPAGINDHIMWGVMLAVTFFHGAGKISADHWLCQKFCK
ncbi:MAG: DoxX family protein [Pseudomonadota bacterium]